VLSGGGFWVFSDALFGWIKQRKPENLCGDGVDALDCFIAMLNRRTAPAVLYTAGVEHCSAISCHSLLWRDVTLQFVLYFDIVFDVIACS